MTGFKVFQGYVLVNYSCKESCEKARLRLNGKAMGRMLVKAKIKGAPNLSPSTVHTVKINHLSPTVSEEDLHKVSAPFGRVSSIKVNDKYAYVNFEKKDSASNVIKYLNGGVPLGGQTVTASLHDGSYKHDRNGITNPPPFVPKLPIALGSPTLPSCTIKATLNKPISNDDLLKYFSSFGTVEGEVKVHSGSPDFVYINFSSPDEAIEACKEKTTTFKNVTLNVKLSNKTKSVHAFQSGNSLANELLVRSDELEKKLSMFNVSVTHSPDKGILIKGSAADVARAKVLLESMTNTIEAKLVKKSKTFHCCAIPLLINIQLFETLSLKHCVEFKVKRTGNGAEETAGVFCDMFARHCSKPSSLSKVNLFGSYTDTTPLHTWYVKNGCPSGDGMFVAMSQIDSNEVEALYQSYSNDSSITVYTHNDGMQYEYDFSRMTRTNLDTEEIRELRREEKIVVSKVVTLLCRGYEEATTAALLELESTIAGQYGRVVVDVNVGDSKYMSDIVQLAGEYCVAFELPLELPGQLILKGKQECVDVANIDIKVKLNEMRATSPASL